MGNETLTANFTTKQENYSAHNGILDNSTKFSLMSVPEATIVPVVFAIVFLVGMMGNITLLYYFIRRRFVKSPHDIYVINLAVGDVLMITGSMPFVSVVYTLDEWPFGEAICKMSEVFHIMCTAVIITTIACLSIERYLMGRRPIDERRLERAKYNIVIIWVTSFIISVPDLISSTAHEIGMHICVTYNSNWGMTYPKIMTLIKLLLLFLIPLIIIVIFYSMIIFDFLNKKESNVSIIRTNSNDNVYGNETLINRTRRTRIAIIIACLIIIFVMCWLPRHIYLMWYYFDPGLFNDFWHKLKVTGFCLMYANSSLNPFVFWVLETRFRNFCINCYTCRGDSWSENAEAEVLPVPQQTIILTDLISCENSNAV